LFSWLLTIQAVAIETAKPVNRNRGQLLEA
jgi:hypothetical protein